LTGTRSENAGEIWYSRISVDQSLLLVADDQARIERLVQYITRWPPEPGVAQQACQRETHSLLDGSQQLRHAQCIYLALRIMIGVRGRLNREGICSADADINFNHYLCQSPA